MTYKSLLSVASVGASVVALAACGGSNTTNNTAPTARAAGDAATTLKLAKTSLGSVVVDGRGRTLYLFAKDAGPTSTCLGDCADDWPPLTATSLPTVAGGVAKSQLSLIARPDGKRQVALAGHPLYFFAGDQAAGQVNGQGIDEFGAKWFTVDGRGKGVTSSSSGAKPKPSGGYSW
jgi:predicted lipoprotein with Yx(FWY)xxD motif